MRPAALAAAALVAAALSGASPALSQSTIRILVNDQPITSYDIQQRTRMMQVFSHGKAGESEAKDQLIDEKLMTQEAARRNVSIDDQTVQMEIARRAQAAHLTAAQFEQAMHQAGFDPNTFVQFIRANMAWAQIVHARFRATVSVSDQDVTAALQKSAPAAAPGAAPQATPVEYMLQQILFLLPANAAGDAATRKLAEVNAFRSKFQDCDHTVEQSGGTPGIVVKPAVRRESSQLPPTVVKQLADVPVNGTTAPERVVEGLQILAICARNAIAGETEATVAARAEISDERGQLMARRYLRDLRSDAVIEYR